MRPFDPDQSVLLAVDSATPQVSVALLRGDRLLAEAVEAGSRNHAEILLPQIDEVLGKAGLELAAVDAFAVSIGPGTFTSLRTGLATIKGLAFGGDRPVAAISTLAAVAKAAGAGDRVRVAVLDARRDEFYAGAFDPTEDGNRADLLKESVYTVEELVEKLPLGCEVVGEGATALGESLRTLGCEIAPDLCRDVAPSARAVAALAAVQLAAGQGIPAADLVPQYLRRAQAEEDRLRAADNQNDQNNQND